MSDLSHHADVKVTIYFRKPRKDSGHISAYTTYPTRPGENWHRGNDLADGGYNKTTLDQVFRDIREVYEEKRK